ncbi:MAG: glycosyltransferase, partial [Gemmatimonadota bacterium]|nr:glycosyltransferase [Gemmatimonadota bacterium]
MTASELETQIRQLRATELFDPDWYCARYGDVALLGMGPEEHYLRIGARLLREPGPHFSTGYYLTTHADVARSGMNPLLHFVNNGRAEGRTGSAIAHLTAEQQAKVREAFDEQFYMSQVAETEFPVFDALHHYLSVGWKQGLDPHPDFSTSYYLKRAADVRGRGGTNPLVHYVLGGKGEGRRVLPYAERIRRVQSNPKVSVIVPNYNHGRFLDQRLQSILNQTYQNIEVIVLDDCSSDNSVEVISRHCDCNPDMIRCILNTKNSGNVFRQWRKGVEEARGELVWICESDDFCDPGFLEALVPNFKDRSINVAFGRIQFSDREGGFRPGLDAYREGAEPGIWGQRTCRPASEWFSKGFGVNNVIANVGGCVFRRQSLSDAVWEEAQTYTVLGDWFLYANLSGGGQIVYEPDAVAFFR